jgi:hypothetical protein
VHAGCKTIGVHYRFQPGGWQQRHLISKPDEGESGSYRSSKCLGSPELLTPIRSALLWFAVGGKEESGRGFEVALRGELVEGLDRYGPQSAMNSGAVT